MALTAAQAGAAVVHDMYGASPARFDKGAWVAAGRRAAYVTDGHLRDSVHFAAGIALCQAAGCVVTGIHGQPLHTGPGGLVVAADRETHTALLDLIGDRLPPGR
ncbi:inositol monophosphatase family protein [Actinoallomurus rhizosphaericola]|uniref:inositol monophosphatase family protein n=1 Tax=Actinoallomurus rhizosphaericola TaxID=2952536 RepID=UPI00209069A0|nr:inositol monophosphatase family protein [Actinoallomurus rhizosphaericola]MCO5993186.1 hypothetical protein [Actinoallomurus rhizosphaericola]